MGTFRRKSYVVDKKLQYRLLGYNAIYFFISVSALGLALFTPLVLNLSDPSLSPRQQVEAADRLLYLHASLWPGLLLILIILGFHSLIVSNRIAGPLYRFRAVFEKIAEGDLTLRVPIRKGDLLVNEQTKIEEMVSALRARISVIRAEEAALGKFLLQMRGQEIGAETKMILAQMKDCHERLRKETEFFKIE